MAETLTPNYHWIKPDIGGDASTWGYVLNTTIDAIDSVAFNNQTNQGNYLPLVGGTITGYLTVNSGITTNGFVNTSGVTISQASGSGNAHFLLTNNAGTAVGYFYWAPDNTVHLLNTTGNGQLTINTDGSISTSGAFHTAALSAAGVSCSSVSCSSIYSSGDINTGGNIYGNTISATGNLSANGNITSGSYITGLGYCSKQGTGGPPNTSHFYNTYWSGSQNHLYLDSSDWGVIQTVSDYRMKKDVSALGSMWERVKALKPISYTHRDWTPPASVEHQNKVGGSLIRSDNVERWGFLAHELQETLVESAANGVKDDPVAVQSPNPFTVIAALTKALQEAMTRIEALEAR